MMSPEAVSAANGDWNIDANAPSWGSSVNWLGGTIGGGTAGDTVNLNFTLTAARTINLDGDRTVGTLNMNGTAAFGLTLLGNNGGSLVFDNGVGTAALNFLGTTAAMTVQAPIVLNSNLEISANTAFGNVIAGNITGAKSVAIDSNGAHPVGTASSVGDVVLRGNNSFSGGLALTEARIQALNGYTLGTGAVTVNTGGGIYMPSGGNWKNVFNLTGLGWNEATGLLGALRVDNNSVFTNTINIVSTGASPTARINAHAASTSIFNGVIAGGPADALEFTTSGTNTSNFIINNTNTNTGTLRIGRATAAAGTTNVLIGNSNTSGQLGSGAILLDAGGVLQINRTDAVTIPNAFSAGAGAITQLGIGSTILSNASILNTGGFNASGLQSRLTLGTGGALTIGSITGTSALSNFADLEFNTSSNINLNNTINGARGTYMIQSGTGITTLSGIVDNSSGKAIVNAGTFILGKTATSAIHTLGTPYVQYALILNGGTVQYGGSGQDQFFDQSAVRINGGTLDLNGNTDTAGTFTGSAGLITNSNATAAVLTMGGQSTATGIFYDNNTLGGSTVLHAPNFSGTIADGVGSVGITKANTGLQILGGTNTYSGATTVTGGLLAITGSTSAGGTVNVNGGSLAGTGSVGNIVNFAISGQGVRPGATGQDRDAVATLNATSLTVNGGDLRLNYAAGVNDVIALSGAANFTAASTVTPIFTAPPVAGTSTIITGSAAPTLTVGPTVTLPVSSRITGGTISASGNDVVLTLTGANAQSLNWSAGTATWDLNTTANFNAGAEKFFNLDSVTFSDAAGGFGAVTLAAGTYVPSGIIDTTTGTNNVSITGAGIISGSAGIIKSGNSTLTVSTPNTFTGDVNINAGTLVAGNATALGDITGQTNVASGATLDINGINLGGEIVNIAGAGVGGLGALVNNSATVQQQALRFVRLTADATVGGSAGRWDIRQPTATANVVEQLDLGGFTLTKVGTGEFHIVGVNVTDGNIISNSGLLAIETNSLVQGTGIITVNGAAGVGSTLAFYQSQNGNVTRPIVLNGTAGTVFVESYGQNNVVNSPISTSGNLQFQSNGGTHSFYNSFTETATTNITKIGTSTFNLVGNVSYTGATSLNQGVLGLGGFVQGSTSAVTSVNIPGAVTIGQAIPIFSNSITGAVQSPTLNIGSGGYTTLTGAPAAFTINNGTLTLNSRVSNTVASNFPMTFNGGANQINFLSPEQDVGPTLTGTIGSSTKFGRLIFQGGTNTLSATSSVNINLVQVTSNNGAAGIGATSEGILNIVGGNHFVQSLYLGDTGITGAGTNGSGIVNMSGGTLTFQPNGAASLLNTNNSGAAMFGADGFRIGHWSNGNSVSNGVNLSAGTIDASQTTVSVGWDGSSFLNITGGTLKARTLVVEGGGTEGSPFVNRIDVTGGANIEIGFGGMPTDGTNSSINAGNSTWTAKESAEWTRGMNMQAGGTMTLDTGVNRVGLTGQLVGSGNLTKTGNGVLALGTPQLGLALTTTAGNALITNAAGTILPGMMIVGNPNIPAGSYVVTVNSATTFTINSGTGVLAGSNIPSAEIFPNLLTGTLSVNAGTLRLNNPLALGDGPVVVSNGATLDTNGFQSATILPATAPASSIRPNSISLGGTGTAGSLGGFINSSGNTGGIAPDNGGVITITADTTIFNTGRLELGGNIGGAGYNNTINAGSFNVTKNGAGQFIWRGKADSTVGNIVINGGHFYAEENNNNLGVGGMVIVNPGGALSAWQSGGVTSQNKAIVLNGGALMADITSTWNGGLTLTADSFLTRNVTNAAVVNLDSPTLNLGGYTLTKRDRAGILTITNNTATGNGNFNVISGQVNLGTGSVWDGTGVIKIGTDAQVAVTGATASIDKGILLAGGAFIEKSATSRSLGGGLTVAGYGVLGATAGGALTPANIVLSNPNSGMNFVSGTGWLDLATAGAAQGSVSPTQIGGVAAGSWVLNPNFTVGAAGTSTTANDMTFAKWDGTKFTGIQPNVGTIAGAGITAGTNDLALVTAAETVAANKTIGNLIAEQTITINAATVLTIGDSTLPGSGGVILRELATGGFAGAGSITSGRKDGMLAVTTANAYSGFTLAGDVGAFPLGALIADNLAPTFGTPVVAGQFTPTTLVKNGPGNVTTVANNLYTGGTIINAGRIHANTALALGLGNITIRDGGTLLTNVLTGFPNNISVTGLGMTESVGTFGALRVGGSSGAATMTGTVSLNSAITRIHGSDTGSILGNITGSNSLERTGGGNLIVRSAADYTGATIIGNPALGLGVGTHTVWKLADGGIASSLGASSNAASNLQIQSGNLNYIGGGASTDRLFTVNPNTGNAIAGAQGLAISNSGYGNLNFTNTGAILMNNGAQDVTLTLNANNFSANKFSPSLTNPANARLNINVSGTAGSWELNGSSYNIAGTVALSNGGDLIMKAASDVTIPILTGANGYSYLVQSGTNTITLGGSGLLAEADNGGAFLMVNSGTVVFDKRGNNAYTAGSAVGPGTGTGVRALGGTAGEGLVINGGTVRYASTANMDQIFDQVDVLINGGTLDFNGKSDTIDSLNGSGGVITNGAAGTVSVLGLGANNGQQNLQFAARSNFSGVIQDGLGQVEVFKVGNGTQTLSGANTYTGKTSITNGFLQIDDESRLGTAPASLVLNQLTFAGGLNIGGGLEVAAGSSVTIDDATRGIWVQNAESGMKPNAGSTLTFATPVRGPGGFQMVGEGNLVLSGANVNTGATSIYKGTLTLDYSAQNNSKLADAAALILRGGNVVLSGGSHSEFVSATTIDGGGVGAGASYISRSSGTSVLNLNGITRPNGTTGGTLDIAANGLATTDTANTNGIITGAGASGFTGTAYATVGKTNWATSGTTAADTAITGLGTYQTNNFATATNHVDVTSAVASLAANSTVSTLRFNGPATTLTGSAGVILALNQQGILMTPNAGATTISVPTLTGFAAQTAAITTDIAVHQHSASDLTISSIIANTTAATFVNTTGLTKSGAGKLILTGVNTYTGITFINEGSLELNGAGTAGTGAGSIWIDGTLILNKTAGSTVGNGIGGSGTILKTNADLVTMSGGIGSFSGNGVISQGTLVTTNDAFSNANQINDLPANGTVYGSITLGDANTGANNVAYYSGRGTAHTVRKNVVVSALGTGSVVIGSGTGTATVAFAQTFQGNFQLNRATTLRADNSVAGGTTIAGNISGNVGTLTIDAPLAAAVALNTAPGTVVLQNNNNFTGDIVVNGAILQVGTGNLADIRDQIPDASNVTLNGTSATKQAGLTLSAESEAINNLNGDVNTFIQAAAAGGGASQMRLTVLGTGTFSGLFHGANNGGMTIEKAGSGVFTIGGTADNNTGRVLVTSGILEFAKTSTGSVHAIGADSVIRGGELRLAGTGGDQIYDNAALTFFGGTLNLNGTNETAAGLFGDTGTVTNNHASTASTFTLGGFNNSSLFGGTIQNGTSTLGLGKTGTGGVVLTGANTYTGATTINGGYIQLGNGGTTGSIDGTSNVVTSANTQLIVNRSNSTTLANAISGAGGIVQNGTGQTVLTSDNAYTGPTVINAGSLSAGNGGTTGSFGTGNVTISAGTTAIIDHSAAHTTANAFGGEGTLVKQGAGIETLSGSSTHTGPTNLIGGTLLLASDNRLSDMSPLNLSSGTTLNTGGFSDTIGTLSIAGTAPATGAIIDMGAGSTSQLTFMDVGTWSGLLSVWNYNGAPWTLGNDKLVFTAGSGTINLANVNFYSDSGTTAYSPTGGGALIGNELVPVPEPSAIASLLALLGLAGYKERRRFFHFRK